MSIAADCQPAIFDTGSSHHYFLEFEVTRGGNESMAIDTTPIREALRSVLAYDHAGANVRIVVGFGNLAWSAIAAASGLEVPNGFGDFSAMRSVDGHELPATQNDIFLWLQGNGFDEVFAAALDACRILDPVTAVKVSEHGFVFRDSRDLTGFIDGSANPKEDARFEAALIGEGPCRGGSIALAQRWLHNLTGFEQLTVAEQEAVIGRTKPDSIEFEGDAMPVDAHVARTDLKIDGVAQKIFRRSAPIVNMAYQGLYFLGFSQSQERLQHLLDSMYGLRDGIRDHLLDFSTPVASSYYFVPPRTMLQTISGV
jgi:putative iron-dependent peroxidase